MRERLIPIAFILSLSLLLISIPRFSAAEGCGALPCAAPQAQQVPQSGQVSPAQSQQAPQAPQSGTVSSQQVQQAPQPGQVSPAQVQQGLQALQSGQVTPAQVQQAQQALQSGAVSPQQAQQLMGEALHGTITPEEIQAGMELLEKQKAAAGPEKPAQVAPSGTAGEAAAPAPQPAISSLEADRMAFFARVFGPDFAVLKLFGGDLFTNPPQAFAPITNVPVSDDYIIGAGDAITIVMWGRMEGTYTIDVDNEGVINVPKIGPLTVAGLTFREVKKLITGKAEAITGVNVSVSMGRLRTIQVFVLGEVQRPGVQTVSSLATAVNALLAAGGPTLLGSLRHIEVKRQGRSISVIDLYDFLLHGDISGDQRLMPADVIFVPRVGPLVAVSGNVKNPAVYELKDSQTLGDALALSGGLAPRAFNQRLQIKRAVAHKSEIVVDIPYAELADHEHVRLQDGDALNILSVLPTATNAVYLYGNVLRPGPYAYKEGMRLLDLIPDINNTLPKETCFEYALIKRYHLQDMSTEIIPFDLGQLLNTRAPAQNLALRPLDEVYIFNKWMVEPKPAADIEGEVRTPGSYQIDTMNIKDLIFKAGGFTRDALMDFGHLYRTDPRTKEVTLHSFNVDKALQEDAANNLRLQDHDRVVIHSIREYIPAYNVVAKGELTKPDKYPYADNMTVKDLILVAGNVKRSAYMDNGEIVRFDIINGKMVQISLLSFNVKLALEGDPAHNLKLLPWDIVTIKQIPEWGENREITVSGEVLFPGIYSIRRGERLSTVLERAGGFTERAYFRGAVFTRESVRVQQQQRIDDMADRLSKEITEAATSQIAGSLSADDLKEQQAMLAAQQSLLARLKNAKASGRVVMKLVPGPGFAESEYNLAVEAGDTLVVPVKPDTVAVAGEVYNPASIIFNSSKPQAENYLTQTGGPTKYANASEMFIVRADGSVASKSGAGTGAWLSSFANTPLYPGDTLVVPPKLLFTSLKSDLKDITSIVYQIAVSAGIVINQVFK